jgi:alkylation response protein AidB-like acyl-CoA dehydrogenase
MQEYWMQHDQSGEYPHELHADLAQDGWIGIALPEDLGGAGLGISEATMMLHTIAEYFARHYLFYISAIFSISHLPELAS